MCILFFGNRNTDKASKQLNLASHSGSTYEGVSHQRRKRDTGGGSGAGNVLEFEIGDYLHLNDVNKRVIRDDFSISAWLYLEGGQPDKGSILGEFCEHACYLHSEEFLHLIAMKYQLFDVGHLRVFFEYYCNGIVLETSL